MPPFSCSVIIPVYNGATTIEATLRSILPQKKLIDELIIVDDGSRDNSKTIAKKILQRLGKGVAYRVISHHKPKGLAGSYNDGFLKSRSELVVTLHQDIILKKDALKALIAPFNTSKQTIVATYHIVDHPFAVWRQYNFWQRCLFSRLMGRKYSGLDGKFDCFRRKTLIKAGLFDDRTYRRAGEDGDIINRLRKIGRLVPTKAEVIHLHSQDQNFALKQYIYKQAQYSEAQGALIRHYPPTSILEFLRVFFRELLVLGLFVPYVRVLVISALVVYAFVYTKNVFVYSWRDWRIIILPFVNVALCFVSIIFTLKGIISGNQKI